MNGQSEISLCLFFMYIIENGVFYKTDYYHSHAFDLLYMIIYVTDRLFVLVSVNNSF